MARPSLLATSLLALPFLFPLTPPIRGQATSEKSGSQAQPVAKPAKSTPKSRAEAAAARAKIVEQRTMGLSLLVSLANDAISFPDQKLRARTLSRIADALWEPDPEQGRALFRRAWDAATVADQESARRLDEDRKKQVAATGTSSSVMPPDLRLEVLRLAAKHDRALGEEFLDKLTEAKKQETTEATSTERNDPFETPAALRQRLRLARQLLDTDVERALQFADRGLTTVTIDGLSFLSYLRDKNPGAADQRFARMLAFADADLQSDANTISLLSSYLFTPQLFVTFLPNGGQQSSQMKERTEPPEVAPELRLAFFRTAAQVLLRPVPNKEQDRSSSGIQGKSLVIRRLMPLFEKYAAQETVQQLRNELASLSQGTNENPREDFDEGLQRGIAPERKAEDIEKSLLDRIERARTSEERDGLYLQLANRAAAKGDMRARDFTEKIEDIENRKQARPYVDMSLAMTLVEKKEFEKALFVADKGELSQIQKVWLLAQAAKAMPPAEREKAIEVIEQATVSARRIGGSDPDRPRALVAVANSYLGTDRPRAWEMMLEVVKASNSAEGFSGEDGRLVMRLQTKFQNSLRTSTVDDFNLSGIFRSLALENAPQSVEIARSFEGEAPRASALIAIARALLSEKPSAPVLSF